MIQTKQNGQCKLAPELFTLPLRRSVNILPLFTSISNNNIIVNYQKLPFSFIDSRCACKTLSLISEVLQKPSRAGTGRDVLQALFLNKNCKQWRYIIIIIIS